MPLWMPELHHRARESLPLDSEPDHHEDNWKRATPLAANAAIISSLVVLFIIKIFGIQLPYSIDAGAFTLVLSLTIFMIISFASPQPELDPEVEYVMDM